jgi:hypothetical protein
MISSEAFALISIDERRLLWNQNVIQMWEMIEKLGACILQNWASGDSKWMYVLGCFILIVCCSFPFYLFVFLFTTMNKAFFTPRFLVLTSCSIWNITNMFFFFFSVYAIIFAHVHPTPALFPLEMLFCFLLAMQFSVWFVC